MTDAPVAVIGDNLPPADADPLRDRLAADYKDLGTRKDDLLEAAERVPATVKDEEAAGKVADFIKQLAACHNNAESHRKKEKEDFLKGGRNVDGWFKQITEPLAKVKKDIEKRLTLYQREVMITERRIREEAQRKADEAAKLASEEAAKAAAAIKEEGDLGKAIEAEERAKQAEADAIKAQEAAIAKAADLARTRGDYGGVASLRTRWTGVLTDRATLKLEFLRDHIPEAALEAAIRSFVKAGGRVLEGARIYEDTQTVVR